jgi:2-desacetyl-2-hydroxyethyl bacteriochlorophyllide A dehydrogenase
MDITTTDAVVIERPKQTSFRSIKLTEVTPDSIVCRTTLSAISSGTDMKTWRGQQHSTSCWYPLVPGYENVGVIEQIGPEAKTSLQVGDRVMINECRKFGDVCAAWGGNARYIIKNSVTAPSPFDYAVKIPDRVSDRDAVLGYLACVSLKGVSRFSFDGQENILVIGAGMIGIGAMQALKILNPKARIICLERSAFRRDIASHYADLVIPADDDAVAAVREATGGKMADKLVECSGNPTVVGGLHKYVKEGGWTESEPPAHIHLQGDYPERIVLDSWNHWFCKNCTVTMSCALAPGNKETVLGWLDSGRFDTSHLPVETFPVEKCHEAFTAKEKAGDKIFKVILDWA